MRDEAQLTRALAALSAGDLELAYRLCEGMLAKTPHFPDALNLLGVISNMSGKPVAALGYFVRATDVSPDIPLFWFNRGGTLRNLGRYLEAIDALNRAIGLAPQVASIWLERGLCHMELKDCQSASVDFGNALALVPDDNSIRLKHAISLHHAGHLDAAIVAFRDAIAQAPGDPDLAFRLGLALQDLDRHELAATEFERAIQLSPCFAKAHVYLGISQNNLGRFEEALALFNAGLRLDPTDAATHWYCGKSYHRMGRDSEALAAYNQAIALDATNADVFTDRGYSYFCVGDYVSARADYDVALKLDPSNAPAHVNLALLLLLHGDFARGWTEYEWRWRLDSALVSSRKFGAPQWNGEALDVGKRILLHGEQGLGDTIQFCRYASLVAARGFEVILEVEPTLAVLLQESPGMGRVVPAGAQLPEFDVHCPLMSLPRAFLNELPDIPATLRYLAAPKHRHQVWQNRLGPPDRPRIGVVWRGNPRHLRDAQRSIPLPALAALFDAPASFFSLQQELHPDDVAVLPSLPRLGRFESEIRDFADTAALCELMDLVISVDTSVAHLAGALGRPVWVLLPVVSDWRWLLGRDDSPWYPSARLYRQSDCGEWASVIARVRRDLDKLAQRMGSELM